MVTFQLAKSIRQVRLIAKFPVLLFDPSLGLSFTYGWANLSQWENTIEMLSLLSLAEDFVVRKSLVAKMTPSAENYTCQ